MPIGVESIAEVVVVRGVIVVGWLVVGGVVGWDINPYVVSGRVQCWA